MTMKRCVLDMANFFLFTVNLICFILFAILDGLTISLLFGTDENFLGKSIEPNFNEDNPTVLYFTGVIIFIVVFSFLALFTCLGCCGTAVKSSCMIGSFIVIEFVMLGGGVGMIVFFHQEYSDKEQSPIYYILAQELARSLYSYTEDSIIIKGFWNWFPRRAQCCGIGEQGLKVWNRADLDSLYKVPASCCKPEPASFGADPVYQDDCMYEPNPENTFQADCASVLLPYAQVVFYGVPTIMFISLVGAFLVTASFGPRQRGLQGRQKNTNNSQYSVGADDEFQHTQHNRSLPTAPYSSPAPYSMYGNPDDDGLNDYMESTHSPPYNPQYTATNQRAIGEYPVGTVRPPQDPSAPLLHQPPPSYNEVVEGNRRKAYQ